jgi:hypothetical protein
VQGAGCRVYGVGLSISNLGLRLIYRVSGFWLEIRVFGTMAQEVQFIIGFKVQGLGFMSKGLRM